MSLAFARSGAALPLIALLLAGCGDRSKPEQTADGPPVTVEGQAAQALPGALAPDTAATDPATPRTNPPRPSTKAEATADGVRDPRLPVASDPDASATLVGLWAATPEACNSGEAVRFSATEFTTEGDSGTWQLAGDRLTIRSTLTPDPDAGGQGEGTADPAPPPSQTLTLLDLTATGLSWRNGAGQASTFVRCP